MESLTCTDTCIGFAKLALNNVSPNSWVYMLTKSEQGVYQFKIRKSHLEETLKNLEVRKENNYYISANGFTGTTGRTRSNLYSLNNIVIDIDCHHNNMLPGLLNQQLDQIVQLMMHDWADDEDLLMPSAVVKTGRGLQFWWFHQSLSARSNYWTWEAAATKLQNAIDRLMREHKSQSPMDNFKKITVDACASCSSTGVYRLPDTYNTATGEKATVQVFSDYCYTLEDLKEFNKSHRAPKKPFYPNKPGDCSQWASKMLGKIETLRMMRNAEEGEETRNNYCLVYYCLMRSANMDIETADQKIHQFNNFFNKPLTNRELERTLVSAKRKEYRMSMKAIKNILDITPEEEDALDLSCAKDRRKKEKLARNKKVIHLYKTGNHSMKEIAELTGLSQPTLRKILRANNVENRMDVRAQKIMDLKEKGYTGDEIAEKLHIGNRTVWRVLKKYREKATEAKVENEIEATVDQPLFSMPTAVTTETKTHNNDYLYSNPCVGSARESIFSAQKTLDGTQKDEFLSFAPNFLRDEKIKYSPPKEKLG